MMIHGSRLAPRMRPWLEARLILNRWAGGTRGSRGHQPIPTILESVRIFFVDLFKVQTSCLDSRANRLIEA